MKIKSYFIPMKSSFLWNKIELTYFTQTSAHRYVCIKYMCECNYTENQWWEILESRGVFLPEDRKQFICFPAVANNGWLHSWSLPPSSIPVLMWCVTRLPRARWLLREKGINVCGRECQNDEVGGEEEIYLISLLNWHWEFHQILSCLGRAEFVQG